MKGAGPRRFVYTEGSKHRTQEVGAVSGMSSSMLQQPYS